MKANSDLNGLMLTNINNYSDTMLGGMEITEAGEMADQLDDEVAQNLDDLAAANPGTDAEDMRDEWQDIVDRGGDPAEKEAFLNRWGNALDANGLGSVADAVDTSITTDLYADAIANGDLTGPQKQQAMDDLVDRYDKLNKDPGFWTSPNGKADIANKIDNLDKLNTFGQMADLYDPPGGGGGGGGGYPPEYPPIPTLYEAQCNAGFDLPLAALITCMPLTDLTPVVDSLGGPVDGSATVVLNAADSGGPISYFVDRGESVTLAPGEQRSHRGSANIAYDTGVGKRRSYDTVPGMYVFRNGADGWRLSRDSSEATITLDGSWLTDGFNYQVDGQSRTLSPGQTVTHQAPGAVSIAFDRGDGGEPARKSLTSGDYYIGVDVKTQRYDLFDSPPIDPSLPNPDEIDSLVSGVKNTRGGSQEQAAAFDSLMTRLAGGRTAQPAAASRRETPAVNKLMERLRTPRGERQDPARPTRPKRTWRSIEDTATPPTAEAAPAPA